VLLIDFAGEGGCSIGQVVICFKQDDARWCRMRRRCWLRWSCVTAQRLRRQNIPEGNGRDERV
jgi:hypothetical protein